MYRSLGTIGSLSSNDGHGYENVTYKVKSRRLHIFRIYSISFIIGQILANIFGVEFERTVSKFRKRKRKFCLVFPSLTKREIWHLHVVVVQWRQRNVHKSMIHVQSCCFACLNLLLFRCSRCRRRRRCLSSLIVNTGNSVQSICPHSAHWVKLLKCWPIYILLKTVYSSESSLLL